MITYSESKTNIPIEFQKRKHDHNAHTYGDVNNRLIMTEASVIKQFDIGS